MPTHAAADTVTVMSQTPDTHTTAGEVPLTPHEACERLWVQHRIRRTPRTLQLYRRVGGGPPFHRAGNEVRYLPSAIDRWARERQGEPLRNNCERSARRLLMGGRADTS